MYLTLNLLNFFNGINHLPFLVLSIIIFRDVKIKTSSWSDNSIKPHQTARINHHIKATTKNLHLGQNKIKWTMPTLILELSFVNIKTILCQFQELLYLFIDKLVTCNYWFNQLIIKMSGLTGKKFQKYYIEHNVK